MCSMYGWSLLPYITSNRVDLKNPRIPALSSFITSFYEQWHEVCKLSLKFIHTTGLPLCVCTEMWWWLYSSLQFDGCGEWRGALSSVLSSCMFLGRAFHQLHRPGGYLLPSGLLTVVTTHRIWKSITSIPSIVCVYGAPVWWSSIEPRWKGLWCNLIKSVPSLYVGHICWTRHDPAWGSVYGVITRCDLLVT